VQTCRRTRRCRRHARQRADVRAPGGGGQEWRVVARVDDGQDGRPGDEHTEEEGVLEERGESLLDVLWDFHAVGPRPLVHDQLDHLMALDARAWDEAETCRKDEACDVPRRGRTDNQGGACRAW